MAKVWRQRLDEIAELMRDAIASADKEICEKLRDKMAEFRCEVYDVLTHEYDKASEESKRCRLPTCGRLRPTREAIALRRCGWQSKAD